MKRTTIYGHTTRYMCNMYTCTCVMCMCSTAAGRRVSSFGNSHSLSSLAMYGVLAACLALFCAFNGRTILLPRFARCRRLCELVSQSNRRRTLWCMVSSSRPRGFPSFADRDLRFSSFADRVSGFLVLTA